MKKVIAIALALMVPTAYAGESVTALVEQANCVQVGSNESVVGGVIGGAAGGIGGALVGSLFGKTGKKLGAIAGGIGGAAYGASGDKIYNCNILTKVGGEAVMVSKQSSQVIVPGNSVTLVKNGTQWQAI